MLTNKEDINPERIKTVPVVLPGLNNRNIRIDMLRTDLIHPVVSGNKWFKLQYYLTAAREQGIRHLVTFGGAWSNHIHASAAAAALYDFSITGIIRGEQAPLLSPTLQDALSMGMELRFISRTAYRNKELPAELNNRNFLLIPEGGYGTAGARGAALLTDYCTAHAYTHICCAVGTGTMMAGLMNQSGPMQQVIGISSQKNNLNLEKAVTALLKNPQQQPLLLHDYHFGGYASHTPELIRFMNLFYEQTGIPTDIVYTGKLCFAVTALLEKNYFPPGSNILLIHSGGLQGNRSLQKGTLIF